MPVRTALLVTLMTLCLPVFAQDAGEFEPMGMERAKVDDLDVLAVVHFDIGSAELGPQARSILDDVATELSESPDGQVEVGGHTDSSGAEAVNDALSHQRADAVVGYLVRHGVAAGRLTAIGYGPNQPVESNATAAGRAWNRRVHVKRPG